jgi:hypothetical protein
MSLSMGSRCPKPHDKENFLSLQRRYGYRSESSDLYPIYERRSGRETVWSVSVGVQFTYQAIHALIHEGLF